MRSRMARRRKKPTREDALRARRVAMKARPHRMPPVREERRDGKVYVTVRYQRPWWQRALGADNTCERSFGLDAYGQRVYESCNGRRNVERIVRKFATETHLSIPESEMAVTKFLRTLVSKGLVAMEMDKKTAER